MSNFIFVIVYMIIGFVLKNSKLPTDNLHQKLNKFIIFIALPAMIFLETVKIEFSTESMIPIYISWTTMGISALLVLFISKKLYFTREVTGALMLITVLTNATFVGIPVITAYFGDESLPYIILYDQFGTSFWFATYGTLIVAYYGNKGDVSFSLIANKILKFPPFIAFILAIILSVFFNQHTYPDLVVNTLELITLTIVPFALISVGLQLQFKLDTHELKPFSLALIIKLIISPIIAVFMCYLFGWGDLLIGKVSIMEAGMSPMITAGVIASMNGLAPKLSNAIVAYGIVASLITSWILFLFIQ